MALPDETLFNGAPMNCPDCGKDVTVLKVLCSGAGYYIGSSCDCGPYSRESGYYPSREAAAVDLPRFTAHLRQINN
jgi:predicted amidophosphoribosyltransferase